MQFRLLVVLAVIVAAAMQPASAQSSENSLAAAAAPRKVITWVPPYGVTAAKTQLTKIYGGFGPRNGLTHLALQFWTLNPAGSLVRSSKYGTPSNATIQWFVTWAHQNGIKVVLCVYNGENGWDWNLAKNGFKTHKAAFITQLVNQVKALKLDGIDVDLEGPSGDFDADKPAYIAFIKELARQVHLLPNKKTVTVDSFHYIYNAPNQNWWAALFPLVDGVNSMGYEDLGRNAPTWQKYLSQKSKAGLNSAKLQIGLPSYLPSWQGNTTLQQVQWFQLAQAGRVGIAIWDAQFQDASWHTAAVWKALNYVRTH